jgi:hypothetical protein
MRKIIILLSTLLIIIGCKIQKRDNHQSENNMEYLDLNKYKNWEKDPKYNSTNEMKFYKKEDKRVKILFLKNLIQKDWIQIEESSIITPYTYISIYDSKTGLMLSFTKQFYMMKVGIGKQYNNIGKLIKEEDYDRGYTFTIKDLVQKILKEYKIDLEDRREENSVRRREYKGNLFYEVDMKIKDISIDKYKYLLIDGKTGVLLFETFFYPKGYNQVFPFDKYLNYLKEKDNTTSFNGKTYTEEEWKAFEQEQWEKYQAKRNKKGFWDKLFG